MSGFKERHAGVWIEPVTDLLQIPGSYVFYCKHQTIAQLVVTLAKMVQTKRAAAVEPERALNVFSQTSLALPLILLTLCQSSDIAANCLLCANI